MAASVSYKLLLPWHLGTWSMAQITCKTSTHIKEIRTEIIDFVKTPFPRHSIRITFPRHSIRITASVAFLIAGIISVIVFDIKNNL